MKAHFVQWWILNLSIDRHTGKQTSKQFLFSAGDKLKKNETDNGIV